MKTRLLATAALLVLAAHASADEIVQKGPNGPGLRIPNVTITRVEAGKIYYRTNGEERNRELGSIFQLSIANDPALTDAETAYVGGQNEKAIEGYLKVLRGNEDWKKRYVAPKTIEAANKTGRFDAAVNAYLAYLKIDPAAAAAAKPALPTGKSSYLDTAAKDLAAAAKTTMPAQQKQAVLSLLLDIQKAKGDSAGAAATVEELVKVTGDSSDPTNRAMLADITLSRAKVAYDEKRFAEVKTIIDSQAAMLTEPKQQSEALWLLAEAANETAKTPEAMLDAATAYMRVVAHFRDAEGQPHVAQSLLRTGGIFEKMKDKESAALVYQQLAAEFKGSAEAVLAEQAMKRLNS